MERATATHIMRITPPGLTPPAPAPPPGQATLLFTVAVNASPLCKFRLRTKAEQFDSAHVGDLDVANGTSRRVAHKAHDARLAKLTIRVSQLYTRTARWKRNEKHESYGLQWLAHGDRRRFGKRQCNFRRTPPSHRSPPKRTDRSSCRALSDVKGHALKGQKRAAREGVGTDAHLVALTT